MDKLNELGKDLNKTVKNTGKALKKSASQYGMTESVRDIFDQFVPYRMHFRVPRDGMSVAATLRFELPPPLTGLGNCCSTCYCAACEKYTFVDFTNTTALTTYPYIAGTVRLFDSLQPSGGIIETDPDAGIIDLDYLPVDDTDNVIQICYIYSNCTVTSTCWMTWDSFNNRTLEGTWGTASGIPSDWLENTVSGSPVLSVADGKGIASLVTGDALTQNLQITDETVTDTYFRFSMTWDVDPPIWFTTSFFGPNTALAIINYILPEWGSPNGWVLSIKSGEVDGTSTAISPDSGSEYVIHIWTEGIGEFAVSYAQLLSSDLIALSSIVQVQLVDPSTSVGIATGIEALSGAPTTASLAINEVWTSNCIDGPTL